MTVPELLHQVLLSIRNQFYADRVRDFKRDERAITKAIARYGYECAQRGWELEPAFILREIMAVLQDVKRRGNFQYLPVYLHGALSRSVGQRAEELQAQARRLQPKVAKVVAGVRGVEAVREPPAVEVLATVYRDMVRQAREARFARRGRERKESKKQQEFGI